MVDYQRITPPLHNIKGILHRCKYRKILPNTPYLYGYFAKKIATSEETAIVVGK